MLPRSTPVRYGAIAVVLALCFLLSGCVKSKVTKENYDKINTNMTLAEVEAILGKGEAVGDGSNVAAQVGVDVTGGAAPSNTVDYVWESGAKKITVTVIKGGGKVLGKRSEGL
jgi:hypothetical protein